MVVVQIRNTKYYDFKLLKFDFISISILDSEWSDECIFILIYYQLSILKKTNGYSYLHKYTGYIACE